jgi:FkbM family methyltransferase
VPRTALEKARERQILVSVLRHSSIAALGSFTVPGSNPITLAAVDSRLTRMLYWYGADGYEQNEVFWWRRLCEQATGILEIGANIGYYTVHGALAAPNTPYLAVEAHPSTIAILRRNLALNSLDHVNTIHGAVVGTPVADHLDLALPDFEQYEAPTGAFLNSGTEGVGERRAAHRTISVPALGASALVSGVDLIKLDIEGAEYDVLHALKDTILEGRVTVLVEVLRNTPRLRSLLLDLERQGYGFWLVSGTELRRVPGSAIESSDIYTTYGSRDVAVIPDERRASLAD